MTLSKADHGIADSAQSARHEQQLMVEQTQADASRLSDAKAAEKQTKAKAK
jgi:hypothetical protein